METQTINRKARTFLLLSSQMVPSVAKFGYAVVHLWPREVVTAQLQNGSGATEFNLLHPTASDPPINR
jgi:hypothetical protein